MKNKNFTNKYKSNFTPMTPKKDGTKKTVVFWVLFVLIIFWTVGSIFGTLSFFNVKLNSNIYTAKADSVQDTFIFRGNNQFTSTCNFYNDGSVIYPNANSGEFWLSTDYIIRLVPSSELLPYDMLSYYGDYLPVLCVNSMLSRYPSGYLTYGFYNNDYVGNGFTQASTYTDVYNSNEYTYYNMYRLKINLVDDGNGSQKPDTSALTSAHYYGRVPSSDYSGYYSCIQSISSPFFNCNVVRVTFSGEYYDYFNLKQPTYRNCITLYDNNNNYFSIYFISRNYSNLNSQNFNLWENRSYYLTNSFSDNQNYKNGFDYGYQQGKNDYLNSGFQDGINVGYQQGYNQGKTDGIASSNDYTFLGLFSALIDAPIQALSGLFNFNVMGINMFSLVSGLFTLFVVLIIVRLILGGGIGG